MAMSVRELNRVSYDRKVASLETLYATYDRLVAEGVDQATFDTGTYGARQHVKNSDLSKIQNQITILESQVDRLARILNCEGLYRMRMSRYR